MKAISELFQSKAMSAKATDMKMIFYFHANKTHFPNKQFAFSLILELRNGLLQTFVYKPFAYTRVSEGL